MSYKYSSRIEFEYGLSGPLVFKLVHNGPDNDVFIVTDTKNNKYVLRQSKRLGKNVAFETKLLTILAQSGFSSSQPLPTISKAYSIVIDTIQLVLFVYIEGVQIEKLNPEHLETDIIKRGARKFGELHSLTRNIKADAIHTRTIFTEYDRLLKLDVNVLKQFKDYEMLLKQVKEFYSEAQSKIESGKVLQGIIHNDYRIQNLIYTKDDCFIIDFDWACRGPLLKDLGLAIAEWSLYTKDAGPSMIAINKFLKGYNETASQFARYDKDLMFWICFACLSDTCTFLADVVDGQYPDKIITDVDQCYMYRKFKYFYGQSK